MKKYIKDFIPDIDIIIFATMLFVYDVYIKLCCGMGLSKLSIIYNAFYIFIICFVLGIINHRSRLYLEMVIGLLFSVYCFSQVIHFNFFNTLYRLKKLKAINELNNVFGEVFNKIDVKSITVFIIYVIFVLYILLIAKKKFITKKINNKKWLILCLLLILLARIEIKTYLKMNWIEKGNYGDSYLRDKFYSNTKFVNRFGVYDYLNCDILSLLSKKSSITEEMYNNISNYIDNIYIKENNKYTNIYKGKNLILIECESLNNFPFFDDLLPTLCKIKNEGIYFDNFYAPLYPATTSDVEFISLTSMLPSIDEGQTCYSFSDNAYPYSLPYLFKNSGYKANSFHANYTQFYNRGIFHEFLGFDTFYDMDKMSLFNLEGYQEYLNWISDDRTFEAMMECTDTSDGKPIFNFITTVSGHIPYVDYRDEIGDDLAFINSKKEYDYMNKETKAYIAAQMSLDKGLKVLLENLEEKRILNDTIIILFGDHYPYGIEKEESKEIVWDKGIDIYKVPLIIYDPSNPKGEVNHNLTSIFDIYPTVCNMFGLNNKGAFIVGRDAFELDHKVYFSNRSILTNDFYYDSETNDAEWTSEPDEEKLMECLNEVNVVFDYGKEVLIHDYFSINKK